MQSGTKLLVWGKQFDSYAWTWAYSSRPSRLLNLTRRRPRLSGFRVIFYIETIHRISWIHNWGYHGSWCCSKTLKAWVFWKRHSDVVILLRWAIITAEVWILHDFWHFYNHISPLVAAWWASLSVTVAKSPLSQRSEQGDELRLRILLVARVTGKIMAAPKRSSFGIRLLMNFLTYHGIYFRICDHWKWQQARNFRGRSEWQ